MVNENQVSVKINKDGKPIVGISNDANKERINQAINDMFRMMEYESEDLRTSFSTAARWLRTGNYEAAVRELTSIESKAKNEREVRTVIRLVKAAMAEKEE